MTPTIRLKTIHERAIEVLDIPGDPARPAVVLLHEGLGSVGLWREFPEALAASTGARTLAYSRHGHGASDPPPRPRSASFMHEEAHELLPRLLRLLGASSPILVGHSDGASIALLHAARHPVAGVVAIAPHVFVEEVALAEIRAAQRAYEHGTLRQRMARHHRDPAAAFHGWSDAWLNPSFRDWNIAPELRTITCPVLLIQGLQDQYGTLAQLDAVEDAVAGPVQRLHLEARHAPHLEAPAATLPAVAAFIQRAGGAGPPASDGDH